MYCEIRMLGLGLKHGSCDRCPCKQGFFNGLYQNILSHSSHCLASVLLSALLEMDVSSSLGLYFSEASPVEPFIPELSNQPSSLLRPMTPLHYRAAPFAFASQKVFCSAFCSAPFINQKLLRRAIVCISQPRMFSSPADNLRKVL